MKKDNEIRYCDLSCKFSDFLESVDLDGSMSCRTFIGLYCRKLKKVVPKNSVCELLKKGKNKK